MYHAHMRATTRRTRGVLLTRLIELQGSRSDSAMAAWLGIDRSHWAHIRAGRRTLTLRIIERAIRQDGSLIAAHVADVMASSERSA